MKSILCVFYSVICVYRSVAFTYKWQVICSTEFYVTFFPSLPHAISFHHTIPFTTACKKSEVSPILLFLNITSKVLDYWLSLVFSKVSPLWLVRAPIFPCSLCPASWSFNLYMHKLLLWRSLYRVLELFLYLSPLLFDSLPSTFRLLHPYWNMFSCLLNSVTLPHSTLPPFSEK